MNRRRKRASPHRNRYDICRMIESSLANTPPFTRGVRVAGKPASFCDGMFHANYKFYVDDKTIAAELTEKPMMVRMLATQHQWQCDDAAMDRIGRESVTLQRLDDSNFPMRTPVYISDIYDGGRMIGFIETFLPGGAMGKYSPVGGRTILHAIASAATATHQLEPHDFDHLPSYANRREHVDSMLNQISENTLEQFSETRQAKTWIENHLPPEVPSSVLHGDLLPQNLLVIFDFESPSLMPHSSENEKLLPSQIGVVDWQAAKIGSPAYDLAIVTRGKRKIGKGIGGRHALLTAYLSAGGQPIQESEIINFELLLFMIWIQESLINDQDTSPPEHYAQMLAGILKRLRLSSG